MLGWELRGVCVCDGGCELPERKEGIKRKKMASMH